MAEVNIKWLAEQLDAAQKILDEIRRTSGCEAFGPFVIDPARRVKVALAAAIKAKEQRNARPKFLGNEDLFGEPAWDILLDLFIRQTREEKVSVRTGSIDDQTPATTTLRWFLVLEDHGLIAQKPDPDNSKRALLSFTPTGYEAMLRYFEAIDC
jgi:hypothetical protein